VSRVLTWRPAARSDRPALQEFTCTVPDQRLFGQVKRWHPKKWEQDVQSFIRACRPPAGPDEQLLLGLDGAGIAAVCSLAEQGSAALVKIRAIAVDVRHRGQGGAVADEAMEVALEAAGARALEKGLDTVQVIGWVDPQNEASKRMNTRAGFGFKGLTSDGLEQWILVLDL